MINENNQVPSSSLDITEQNIEKLKELFPEVLTEKKIDFDKLRLILGDEVETAPERYSFTWNGKKQAMQLAQQPTVATLKPNKAKSKNWDETQNLYIEGDNLEVLKILQKSYANKVKLIYLDPPYNTGKDFVYRDNFHDSLENYLEQTGQVDSDGNKLSVNTETSGRYHTDWLNMMYPRLKLARNLLMADGVIFISIDDNEQPNLMKLCDEIFGENNRIGPIIQNKQNAKNDTLNVQRNHEFIVIYRKGGSSTDGKERASLQNNIVKYRDVFEENGEYYYLNDPITTRGAGGTLKARPNLGYSVYYNPVTKEKIAVSDYDKDKAKISDEESEVYTDDLKLISEGYTPIRPPKVRGQLGAFTWELSKFNAESKNIVITGNPGSYSVRKRTFVSASDVEMEASKLVYGQKSETNSRSIIDFSTNEGSNTLTDLLGISGLFDNPKNVDMLEYLFSLIVNEQDALFMDFFSGSASTAHAIMNLNAKDNKKRKYVLVQLPEQVDESSDAYRNGYSTIPEIAEERIRRTGDKIITENPELTGELDIGFKVFELEKSNLKKWNTEPEDLVTMLGTIQDNLESGSTEDDLVYEIMLKQGLELTLPIEKFVEDDANIYKIAFGSLLIVLGKNITSDAAKKIVEFIKDEELENVVVVLQDTGFANDSEKLNSIETLNVGGVDYNDILSI
ncbi:site-specific DNA-methyltransferase [Enterococcus casseliflavus]|uniref:site-specific DNA-methyltransferase n=1 Tax=Enterococcus casseliflavus TaxID=37734 RepID=UPI0022E35479|nr:site-specific DNA-methyltransferase [Enterococcus casseliflavus]